MKAWVFGAALSVLVPLQAQALEAGDVFSLSSNGVSATVTTVSRTAPGTYAIAASQLAANAAEYCERYEELDPATAKGRQCVKANTSATPLSLSVECQSRTIIVKTGPGSGSYRPSDDGGPWASVASPNMIIQGDDLFQKTCATR